MGRRCDPRRQNGWLRKENGYWRVTYRVYDLRGRSKRLTASLGPDDQTRKKAQKRARVIIEKDNAAYLMTYIDGPGGSFQPEEKPVHMPPAKAGAVGELAVSVDLMRKGWFVFRSVDRVAPCDLIALKWPEMIRVEVKQSRVKDGRIKINMRRQVGKFDVLAVYDPEGGFVHYAHAKDLDLAKNSCVGLKEGVLLTRC